MGAVGSYRRAVALSNMKTSAKGVIAIIPARFASTRLPGKPLLEIAGKPMLLHVIERTATSSTVTRIVVATDDERIADVVKSSGHEAWLTSTAHRNGTERLAEVARSVNEEIVVNVQSDEPMIEGGTIDAAVQPLLEDSGVLMSTIAEPLERPADALDPGVVKVVTDNEGNALYFSRAAIPFLRDEAERHGTIGAAIDARHDVDRMFLKHTGLYAYRREFLLKYALLTPTPLESRESLEQLRALEHGYRIRVVKVTSSSIGVDTPEDLDRVRRLMAGN